MDDLQQTSNQRETPLPTNPRPSSQSTFLPTESETKPQLPTYDDVITSKNGSIRPSHDLPPCYTISLGTHGSETAQSHPLNLQATNNPPIFTSIYHDDAQPCIIQIESLHVTPPTYHELELQRHEELQRLIDEYDGLGSPSEIAEAICKWFITMTIVIVVVVVIVMSVKGWK